MAMPVGPLVVLHPSFVAPYETSFILQEKVFSMGDSFDVRDATGQPAFRLQGAAMSMREKKELCDRYGQPVAVLANKLLTMHETVEIYSADGRRLLASVKKQLISFTHGATVHVTGLSHPLEVKGDFRGKNFQIRNGNHVIARVQRKSLMKDMVRFFTGNDHYTLSVAANVDTAFMVALAVVFDTMFHKDL